MCHKRPINQSTVVLRSFLEKKKEFKTIFQYTPILRRVPRFVLPICSIGFGKCTQDYYFRRLSNALPDSLIDIKSLKKLKKELQCINFDFI